MQPPRSIALVALILLVATSTPAWGVGAVTGITVSPSPVCVGEPATATITGTGTCTKLVLNWDWPNGTVANGEKMVGQPPPPFPITVEHTFDEAKSVTVKIWGGAGSDCTGGQTFPLVVQPCGGGDGGALVELCKVVDCGSRARVVATAPQITGGLGALQAGNPLIVGGKRFGDRPGKVHLMASQGSLLLQVDEWYDGGVGGRVPPEATTLCLTGEVQVETAEGKRSNTWIFAVPQIYRSLPAADVRVVQCGGDGNINHCNGASSGGGCHEEPFFSGHGWETASILGFHYNCWGAIGDDSGTDVYEISLKNGWVLDSAYFVTAFAPGEASTSPVAGTLPAGFEDGAPYWRPSVGWEVTPNDHVDYGLFVGIRGPECTSHR